MLNSIKQLTRPVFAIAVLGLALPAVASLSPASAATRMPLGMIRSAAANGLANNVLPDSNVYTFLTLDNANDPTFNQLLGINDAGKISGYFGSGAAGHPNKGYKFLPPYSQGAYVNENFPGSVQTQVVAINNMHESAGFWVDKNGDNFGFVKSDAGKFIAFRNPKTTGTVNQILGLNDKGLAVGFYTDSTGVNHGYALNWTKNQFMKIAPPSGGSNLMAAGINNSSDVTGSYTNAQGKTVGFLLKANKFYTIVYPGAMATTPFGINNNDEIVGGYTDVKGNAHGFALKNPLGRPNFSTVDDSKGVGGTTLNGVNDSGELVGFYVDAAQNTHGLLAHH